MQRAPGISRKRHNPYKSHHNSKALKKLWGQNGEHFGKSEKKARPGLAQSGQVWEPDGLQTCMCPAVLAGLVKNYKVVE